MSRTDVQTAVVSTMASSRRSNSPRLPRSLTASRRRQPMSDAARQPHYTTTLTIGQYSVICYFFPPNVTLARVLAMARCPSVRLDESSRFWASFEASFGISYSAVRKLEYGTSKIGLWVLPSGTFPQTLDLKYFAKAKCVISLARGRWTYVQAVINWTVVGQLITMPPSSNSQPLVYHSDHQVIVCLQHDSDARLY